MRVEVAEYLDRGEQVVAPFVVYARPPGSEAEVALAGATVSRARDALAAAYAELSESYAEIQIEPKEFIDAGDSVAVPVRVTVRGRTSGAMADGDQVYVYRVRAGKVTEIREYRDKAEALKAVGAEE